jgi:hypothetical protein
MPVPKGKGWSMRTAGILVSATLVLCAFALGGCTRPAGVSSSPPSTSATTTTVSATVPVASTPDTDSAQPAAPTAAEAKRAASAPRVSAKSRAHAERIGGTSHEGEKLYFVIGDSVGSEREAQSLLDRAVPSFGDMQSYFIVQRSDNFDGMRPGWWVIIEAYRKSASPENLQFARRGFPGAYVKRATVRTADPIPVYEDLVAQ